MKCFCTPGVRLFSKISELHFFGIISTLIHTGVCVRIHDTVILSNLLRDMLGLILSMKISGLLEVLMLRHVLGYALLLRGHTEAILYQHTSFT